MNKSIQITKSHARRFLLGYQGLVPPRALRGKAGIMAFLRRVNCIQYDPLDIVGHNPDLVLQARVQGYRREMLRELLYQERSLLDGWDKMASIYPSQDWPYFRRWRERFSNQRGSNADVIEAILPEVRQALEAHGPLSSRELEVGQLEQWDWGWPASLGRAALESLYFMGELLIHHRVHTRKYYDFAHKLLDQEVLTAPDPNQSDEDYQDWYVKRRIGSVGLLWNRAGEAWLSMAGMKSPQRRRAIERLVERGEILPVQVEGIRDLFYLPRETLADLEAAAQAGDTGRQAAVIAPLDNLMWDRRMLEALFDFDYRWEVYVPAAKRRYGYYVLPVLYGERFIARFEPVRDSKRNLLVVKNWWWEQGIELGNELVAALLSCMESFLAYSGAGRLEVGEAIGEVSGMEWLAQVKAHG